MKKRTIGILGASANPLHVGHLHVALAALGQLPSLDEVWFMVTPHNPLKDRAGYAPVEHRLHMAHLTARESGELGHRLKVSDFEVQLQRFGVENATAVMLEHFRDSYPSLQPVWLMGADNLAQIHQWGDRWREIMEEYPVGVFSRPGANLAFEHAPAAQQYGKAFVASQAFSCVPGTWTMLDTLTHPASATEIRQQLASGEQPEYISDEVVAYIKQYKLLGV